MIRAAALVALTCVAAPAAADDAVVHVDTGPRWYAVPNVAFDTDDGLGFGVRGELVFDEPGYEPYRSSYVLHAFASLRGYHHHRFRYDRVGFGPERRFRFTAHLAYRQWLNDGYYGIGNGTLRDRRFVGLGEDDPLRKRYFYSLYQPFSHFTLRARLDGPWSLFGSLNIKWSKIEAYPGSLLEEQQPFGTEGGFSAQISSGVLFDTRHPEVTPREGVLLELSGRVAPPTGSGTFGGVLASARSYLALTSWLVFASRGMTEYLFGDVPFYEMVHWGGAIPVAGFGGFETLRGIKFGRWRAPGKAIINTELRVDVLEHTLFDNPFLWELVPYGDVGIVYGTTDDADPTEPDFPLHPAFGAGIRAIYSEAFVGRIDVGFGLDPVLEEDGSTSQELTFGMYVVFDHTF